MALAQAGVVVELREVILKDKPGAMLAVSPKGTVPVLVLPDGVVIDESLQVMHWALAQNPQSGWTAMTSAHEQWVAENDGDFKYFLDRYKYADRYPEHPAAWYRDQVSEHLTSLDEHLNEHAYLAGREPGLVDAALMPFIRQFSMVDSAWFLDAPYPALRRWLDKALASELFRSVMVKAPRWEPGQEPRIADWRHSDFGHSGH
jgi:glutathione S-transferase